jgi:hypothetical protein
MHDQDRFFKDVIKCGLPLLGQFVILQTVPRFPKAVIRDYVKR